MYDSYGSTMAEWAVLARTPASARRISLSCKSTSPFRVKQQFHASPSGAVLLFTRSPEGALTLRQRRRRRMPNLPTKDGENKRVSWAKGWAIYHDFLLVENPKRRPTSTAEPKRPNKITESDSRIHRSVARTVIYEQPMSNFREMCHFAVTERL